MISIKNVKVGYQSCLLQVDELHLASGNVYALVGRNGIGKSTFLLSLLGSLPLIDGEIRIQDKLISNQNPKEIAEIVSFVESKFEGVEFLRVKDYLLLGRTPFTNMFGINKTKDFEMVMRVAEEMHIGYLMNKFTNEISDGERQLCAVARAFVQDTPVILLDEPTAFLDYINRRKLITILIQLAIEKKKCVLISTHDLELTLAHQTPILLAAKGKIALHPELEMEELVRAMEEK